VEITLVARQNEASSVDAITIRIVRTQRSSPQPRTTPQRFVSRGHHAPPIDNIDRTAPTGLRTDGIVTAPPDAARRPDQADLRARAPRLPYMPGIDGLRALAVATVVLYHGGVSWIPGGFLGVDVFLVISGYLITSLLLAEMAAAGRINLARFWIARARRLLPAVVLMVVVVLAAMTLLHPGEVGNLRGAVIASAFYVTNWYQIFAHQSYFAQFARPSVFQHLWSLAVEEQFYLFWPPVMALGLNMFGKRRLVSGVIAGVAGSALLAAILFRPGTDPSRIYYGTDTRAAGLLVGVLLAFAWPAANLAPVRRRQAAVMLDVAGVAALVALMALMMSFGELSPGLYRGGFLLVALVTAVLLATVAHPSSQIGRVFAISPLVWIGKRSYGIYLWHWPIMMLSRPNADVPFGGPALTAMQIGLTVGIAELSYRYVEVPIRTHGLRGLKDEFSAWCGRDRRRRMGAVAASAATLGLASFVAVAPATTPRLPFIPTSAANGADRLAHAVPTLTAAQVRARFRAQVAAGRVYAIGDSVMLGASPPLGGRSMFGSHLHLDAVVGRQFYSAPPIVAAAVRKYRPHLVIVHLGDNGTIAASDLNAVMKTLKTTPLVVFVTLHVARSWETADNAMIRALAVHHRNVAIADWHAISAKYPAIFAGDGIHVGPAGAKIYAAMLIQTIGSFDAPKAPVSATPSPSGGSAPPHP
jgi:peptidoglycan/LPS O-acetylase OafA/YrhL